MAAKPSAIVWASDWVVVAVELVDDELPAISSVDAAVGESADAGVFGSFGAVGVFPCIDLPGDLVFEIADLVVHIAGLSICVMICFGERALPSADETLETASTLPTALSAAR